MNSPIEQFDLFTDGACSGNPGPGGWAYILHRLPGDDRQKVAGAERETTNNRMELLSVIRGLEATPAGSKVRVVSDSQYVGKGITEWMSGWKSRGWMRKEGKKLVPVKNVELWKELDGLLSTREVSVTYVRGHAGHPENEECDEMAVAAYQQYL